MPLEPNPTMTKMHSPAHPGEVLREWLPETLTVTAAAKQLGISRVMLSKILNGKAGITADMALRLAAWLDTTPEAWLGMQTSWDLSQAIKKAPTKVSPLLLHA